MSGHAPVIRRAGASDAVALADLRWAWRVTERDERGMDRSVFVSSFAQWFDEHKHSHAAFIAEAEGTAFGMAWLATVVRVPGPGTWRRVAGNLQSVYVLPPFRGKGVGRLLVDAAINEAIQSGHDYISVHPSALSFTLYKRAGFEESSGVLELDLRKRRRPANP